MTRSLAIIAFAFVLIADCGLAKAQVVFNLNTATNNTDGASLVFGLLTTDGTTGSGLRLGEILTDWEISITEGSDTITLTPSNSFIRLDTLDLFEVNANGIFVNSIPDDFIGIFNISEGDVNNSFADTDGFYSVSATSLAEPLFTVSVDGSGNGSFSFGESLRPVFPETIATAAVPEPNTFVLLATGLTALSLRRSRRSR